MKWKLAVAVLLALPCPSHAYLSAPPEPLSQQLSKAQEVLVATVRSAAPAVQSAPWSFPPRMEATECDVVGVLKGDAVHAIKVRLPGSSMTPYGEWRLPLQHDAKVLLLLTRNPAGEWVPVEMQTPFVPLGTAPIAVPQGGASTENCLIRLLLSGMDDPSVAPVIAWVLHDTVSPTLVDGLKPYLMSPDLPMRDSVLYAYAVNQHPEVIPQIEALNKEMWRQRGSGSLSVTALSGYRTHRAVRYLNPLMTSNSIDVRQEVVWALRDLVDKTSLPYLAASLSLPDPQHIVRYNVYVVFHRLMPSLGPVEDFRLFANHEQRDLAPIKTWMHHKPFTNAGESRAGERTYE